MPRNISRRWHIIIDRFAAECLRRQSRSKDLAGNCTISSIKFYPWHCSDGYIVISTVFYRELIVKTKIWFDVSSTFSLITTTRRHTATGFTVVGIMTWIDLFSKLSSQVTYWDAVGVLITMLHIIWVLCTVLSWSYMTVAYIFANNFLLLLYANDYVFSMRPWRLKLRYLILLSYIMLPGLI